MISTLVLQAARRGIPSVEPKPRRFCIEVVRTSPTSRYFKTYEGAASTSDGHRLPTSATNAPKSRPGPARSVTGTNKEFSAATQARFTPSSGFSRARTVIDTVAPGASEPDAGAASTQAGSEEKAHECI